MKRTARRFLFLACLVLFFIGGYIVVLYALGYEYDFNNNQFLKTGSFSIKTNTSAEIYINGNQAGSTSFLGNNFAQTKLLPKKYDVEVKEDGYTSWNKNINIKAGLLDDFSHIVLLPSNFDTVVVGSVSFASVASVQYDNSSNTLIIISAKQQKENLNLDNGLIGTITPTPTPKPTAKPNISPSPSPSQSVTPLLYPRGSVSSPDQNKVAWFDKQGIHILWLNNTDYQPYRNAGDKIVINIFSNPINDIQWYRDSEHILVNTDGKLFFIEIDNRDHINNVEISSLSGLFYYDRKTNTIYKFDGNIISKIVLK